MAKYSRKGQVALEYLLIVAITLALVVPTTYLFYSYSKESSDELVDAQALKLGRAIVDTAETIFYSGKGSKTVMEITVPENIDKIYILNGKELVFNVTMQSGTSEIVFFSSINLTTDGAQCTLNYCNISGLQSSGEKNLKIESISEQSVLIKVV